MFSMAKLLLHIEGAFVFLLCIYAYVYYDFSWLLFIVLLFLPDLAALGYLVNKRIGALSYNLVHTYAMSLLVFIIGFGLRLDLLLTIGIIWTAHIGMDRLCGFGLKYASAFQDTHLKRV